MKQQNNLLIISICLCLLLILFVPETLFYHLFPEATGQLDFNEIWKLWFDLLSQKYDISQYANNVVWKFRIFEISLPLIIISPLLLYGFWRRYEENRMRTNRVKAEFAKIKDVEEYLGRDGFVLSKKIQMKESYCYEHVLVIGPTGSGKSQSFFFPNLYYLPKDYSIVVTDPKLELYKKSKGYNDSIGRKSVLIKLDDKNVSTFWNPLEVYQTSTDMQKLCELVVKNRSGGQTSGGGGDQEFWDQAAMNVLFTMIFVTKSIPKPSQIEEFIKDAIKPKPYPNFYCNFANIYKMVSTMSFEAIIGLAKFAASLGDEEIYTRASTFSEEIAPEDTRNSMRSVLMPSIAPFLIEDIKYITAYNEIDFRTLKKEATVLYVSVPEHKVEGLEGLTATLYRQIFDILLDEGSKDTGRPVFFLLDEFANIGRLIGIAKALATIRSRKLAVAMCLQSMEQLTRNYTEAEKKEMMNNLKTKLILPGLTEQESLNYFSQIAGKTTIYEKTQIEGEKQVIEKDRLPPHAIRELYSGIKYRPIKTLFRTFPSLEKKWRNLPTFIKNMVELHECIVFFSNKPPVKDSQKRAYLDSKILKIWNKYELKGPELNPKKKFKEAEKRFFSVADIEFLENIGLFLYTNGDTANANPEKQQQIGNSFKYILNFVGMFRCTPKMDHLEFEFDSSKELNLSPRDKIYSKLAKVFIVRAFNWAYRNGMLQLTETTTFPKISFPNDSSF